MEIVHNDPVYVAARCLEANLNRGRMSMLHSALDDIWDGGNIGRHKVVAAVEDGVYVGCATYTKRTNLIQVFVAEGHRRKGVGSKLIGALEELTGLTRDKFIARPDKLSEPFFERNRVIYYPDDFALSAEETKRIIEDPREATRLMKKRQRDYRKAWLERIGSK